MCKSMMEENYSKLRELSTIKGYLSHFTTMVNLVYAFPEFKAKIEYKHFGKR